MPPPNGHQAEFLAFGSRMEAATEALLRVRDEVVATLDRQVTELQQIHRALASAPPPMVVTEEVRTVPTATAPLASRPSLFENAPGYPSAPRMPAMQVAQAVPARHQPAAPPVAMVETTEIMFSESELDPLLERATLDELNDALASAFAMVSSRSTH